VAAKERSMRLAPLASGLAICALVALWHTPASADGSWMDRSAIAPWNVPGAAVPKPPHAPASDLERCAGTVRQPETEVDRAVTAAGWKLFAAYQLFDGTAVVLGMGDADGMCRPDAYQGFVFVKGVFAGTLSPTPMDSRTDGALSAPSLFTPASFFVDFLRYAPSDPLCCASRTTVVQYRVEQRDGKPVVVPLEAETGKNGS